MVKTRKLLSLLGVAALSLPVVSCKNKNKEDLANAAGYGTNPNGQGDFANNGGAYGSYGSGSNVPMPRRDGSSSYYNASKGQFAPVYFPFDSFDVTGAEMSKVREVATYAKRNQAQLIVAGFTDAVGTEEYNRGLGDRRALSVRGALISSGVPAGQIQTVSFGEEMLAEPGNPNSGINRRVEFGVVR